MGTAGQWAHSKTTFTTSKGFLSSEIENFGGVLGNFLDPGVRRTGVRHWAPVLLPDLVPVRRSIKLKRELTYLDGVTSKSEGLPYLMSGRQTNSQTKRVAYPEILVQSSVVIFRFRGVVNLIKANDETKRWQIAHKLTRRDPE